jgi:hypothetical protein
MGLGFSKSTFTIHFNQQQKNSKQQKQSTISLPTIKIEAGI